MKKENIILAIDKSNFNEAFELCNEVKNHVGFFKLGLEFFYSFGSEGINKISQIGVPIFLDLKLHDIPNTVSKAVSNLILNLNGIEMLTLHASGGVEMLKLANETISQVSLKQGKKKPMVLGVTVLTSTSEDKDFWEGERVIFPFAMVAMRAINVLSKINTPQKKHEFEFVKTKLKLMIEVANNTLIYWLKLYEKEIERIKEVNLAFKTNSLVSDLNLELKCKAGSSEFYKNNILSGGVLNEVLHLASNAFNSGIEAIVCSPLEAKFVKQFFPSLKVITPGVRPEWYKTQDDQSRTATPKEAFELGADFIVIGRPITQNENPKKALIELI